MANTVELGTNDSRSLVTEDGVSHNDSGGGSSHGVVSNNMKRNDSEQDTEDRDVLGTEAREEGYGNS